MADITCSKCGAEIIDAPGQPHECCPACGATGRIYSATLEEQIEAKDQFYFEVLRLSAETSATALAVSTAAFGPGAFNDLWPTVAELKHQIETYHGSDSEVRLIASGAFVHARGDRFDERTIALGQYAASEILHERQKAAAELQRQRDEKREQRRALKGWLRGGIGWFLGFFK